MTSQIQEESFGPELQARGLDGRNWRRPMQKGTQRFESKKEVFVVKKLKTKYLPIVNISE